LSLASGLTEDSHLNWDPGALETARFLARQLDSSFFANEFSRGLIDCNRSDDNPRRFPPWLRRGPVEQAREVEAKVLKPYKNKVREHVTARLRRGLPTVLVSVHSFIPYFNGRERKTDLGLLYRPDQARERFFAEALLSHLKVFGGFRVHRNLPYRGFTDCFVNELTRELNSSLFTGIMFELNCGLRHDKRRWSDLQWNLATALAAVAET
jgi:predicted N-formylglutamate amidohydrolase